MRHVPPTADTSSQMLPRKGRMCSKRNSYAATSSRFALSVLSTFFASLSRLFHFSRFRFSRAFLCSVGPSVRVRRPKKRTVIAKKTLANMTTLTAPVSVSLPAKPVKRIAVTGVEVTGGFPFGNGACHAKVAVTGTNFGADIVVKDLPGVAGVEKPVRLSNKALLLVTKADRPDAMPEFSSVNASKGSAPAILQSDETINDVAVTNTDDFSTGTGPVFGYVVSK